MNTRRSCAICQKPIWITCGYLVGRESVTCDNPECRRQQKTKRQRERRYEARMARLREHAARRAVGKGKRGRPAKHVAEQFTLPLSGRRSKARAKLMAIARKRWRDAKARGSKRVKVAA